MLGQVELVCGHDSHLCGSHHAVKHQRIHVNDAPWITAEFKNLVRLRQQAFNNGDKESYCLYRNAVNRQRKLLRNKYFASKVDNLKSTRPSLFFLMINDLKVDALTWKYVDDTTISQTIPRGSLGNAQHAVTAVEDWSRSQLMQLSADKCKEMVIDFKKISHNFSPLEVDGNKLPVTNYAKMLDVTISSDLKWNNHIVDCIKKANKRLFFINCSLEKGSCKSKFSRFV